MYEPGINEYHREHPDDGPMKGDPVTATQREVELSRMEDISPEEKSRRFADDMSVDDIVDQ